MSPVAEVKSGLVKPGSSLGQAWVKSHLLGRVQIARKDRFKMVKDGFGMVVNAQSGIISGQVVRSQVRYGQGQVCSGQLKSGKNSHVWTE
jgi:hypothetical protein